MGTAVSLPREQTCLVCDFSFEGHRGNYVRVLGHALNGATLIAPFKTASIAVLRAPVVLFATFETGPAKIALLALMRTLIARPTRIIVLRAKIDERNWRAWLKRLMHGALARMPMVRLITVVPLDPRSHLQGRSWFVRDPEYWDLSVDKSSQLPSSALSQALLQGAGGRKILVITGGIDPQKGMGLLADLMQSPHWPHDKLHVAVVGKTIGSAKADVDRIASAGGAIKDRYLTDEELLSLYGIAACVWCCYPPDRDMSSGIFGRARQLGVWPVVREGSILSEECRSGGFGTSIPWDDVDEGAQLVAEMMRDDLKMTQAGVDATHEIEWLKMVIFASSRQLRELSGEC